MERITGQLKHILPVFLIMFVQLCFAQRIVTDPKTTLQVGENLIMQLAAESKHNEYLDTIKDKQEEILFKTSAIYASKELNLKTLQNVQGFGTESLYYKEIASTSVSIAEMSTRVLSDIKNSSMINKANAVLAVSNLVAKCTQCVNDFVNIVTNCTVEHPLKKKSTDGIEEKGDSHNLLDRYERMNLASQIVYDLKSIKNQLYIIQFYCQYGDWGTLVKQLDFKTWATIYNGKSISEKIIRQWQRGK